MRKPHSSDHQGGPPSPESYSLCDLGCVEGQNLLMEYHWAEGRAERLPDLTTTLVQLPVMHTSGASVETLLWLMVVLRNKRKLAYPR